MNNKIRNIKLSFWGVSGMLFVHLMCSSESIAGFFLWLCLSALAAFIAFADPRNPIFAMGLMAMLAAGGLTAGFTGLLITTLLVLIPAGVQMTVMRRRFYIDVATVSATGLFSGGVMIIDRYLENTFAYGIYDRFCDFVDMTVKSVSTADLSSMLPDAQSTKAEMEIILSAVGNGLKLMFPSFVIISGILIFSAVLIIVGKYIIPFSNPPRLSQLRLNRRLYTIYCLLYLLTSFISAMPVAAILTNVTAVLTVLVMICGFSVILYYARKIRSRVLSNVVFLFAVPVCLMVSIIPVAVGVLDGIMDFRGKK